jgi:hypothetical protein
MYYNDMLERHKELNDIIIRQVNPKERKIYGNTQLNTQIILSNKEATTEAVDIAKFHNITIINHENCTNILKQHYNIKDDLLLIKTEEKIQAVSGSVENRIAVRYYNLDTRKALDNDLCSKVSTSMKIPIKLTPSEKETYTKLKTQGIDIFNPTHQARNRCYRYSTPVAEDDDMLSSIISNMRNITECAQNGCFYSTVADDDYIACNCGDVPITEEEEFSIISCLGDMEV